MDVEQIVPDRLCCTTPEGACHHQVMDTVTTLTMPPASGWS